MVAIIEPALDPDPVEALIARLDEPNVANGLHQLLDHLDLLAVLVNGLNGLMTRGDTISDSLADAVIEMRGAKLAGMPDLGQTLALVQHLGGLVTPLLNVLPSVESALQSDLGGVGLADIAGAASRAAVRGVQQATTERAPIDGVRALLKVVKDPDVGRALGFVVAIAKALGQELKSLETGAAPAQ
jgi:hypothetical protein